jgi:hypothetical protein
MALPDIIRTDTIERKRVTPSILTLLKTKNTREWSKYHDFDLGPSLKRRGP